MSTTMTTQDGTQTYYKDWDGCMLYFIAKGQRVVAHDLRGHGRSSQVSDGQKGTLHFKASRRRSANPGPEVRRSIECGTNHSSFKSEMNAMAMG